jgi:hypothetical protein
MLRHAHALRHDTGAVCATCERGRRLMARPAEPAPRKEPKAIDLDQLRGIVREAIPMAEACALGIEYLAGRAGVATAPVSETLAALGMTIFKNELEFRGALQRCVSVNKRLRTWAA